MASGVSFHTLAHETPSRSISTEDIWNTIRDCVEDNGDVKCEYDSFVSFLTEFSEEQQALLLEGIVYAAQMHDPRVIGEDGYREGVKKTPYLIHPIGVALLLLEVAEVRDVDTLIGALLHDTIEDTPATLDEIRIKFGESVAMIVDQVTDDQTLSGQEKKQRQIDHAPHMCYGAQLVKLADRTYNSADTRNIPHPTEWDKPSDAPGGGVLRYMEWGQKLHDVLEGTNEALERRLQNEINQTIQWVEENR